MTPRHEQIDHALRLEYLTLGWNVIEGVVAVLAALAAGSVALLAFGIDSFVECASAGVLVWRLGAERRAVDAHAIERLDRRAHRLVGVTLYALAAYVLCDATWSLWRQERPHPSMVGIALTIVSAVVMMWLARAKRRAARDLGSRALHADSFQTTACWWLSILGLCGVGLNALFGWWWADPVAALGMVVLIVREAHSAWKGEACAC
jgi:divalent metal cation (Fe/Co/Zn/Cd) transporter